MDIICVSTEIFTYICVYGTMEVRFIVGKCNLLYIVLEGNSFGNHIRKIKEKLEFKLEKS